MNRISLISFLIFVSVMQQCILTNAQIAVTPNITANALVDRLAGTGIIYSNATLSCPNNASGKFDNGMASSILIDSGIVLTTGRAISNATAYGVNGSASNFASVNNIVNGGDPNLAGIATSSVHDLCKLEFDFVPTGDTIQFRYRFASEEYPEYNCSNFNDIFAFFISGPGYAIPTNVALVPGTNIPVSINSINNGTISPANGGVLSNCTSLGPGSPFTSLYVNNTGSTSITYDGLTSLLTAKAAVTPCSTYHMKFAIADLSDHIYDSGVFLEAGSFSSDIATVVSVSSSNSLATGIPYSMEGCNAAVITLARPLAKPYPQIVTYTLSGTATNGVDVNLLSGSTTIPALGTTATITVPALQDGISEGAETLIFAINGSLCGSGVTETLTMNILEYPTFTKPLNDTICNGQSIPLNVVPIPANPDLSFTWSPSSSLNLVTGSNVLATPSTTTTYTITSSYPGCPLIDSMVTISLDPIPSLSLTPTNVTCFGLNNGIITATGSASLPLTMTLNPGGVIANSSPFTFSNLAPNTYTVTITSVVGCTHSNTTIISAPVSVSWTNTQFVNPLCSGFATGSIQVAASGGSGVLNYTLMPSATSNTSGTFTGLIAQAYTVTATDVNGCATSTIITLSVSNALIWNSTYATNITPCFGNTNGSINVNASGGTGLLSYTLNPLGVSNTSGAFTNLNAAVYTVQVSDINGCSNSTVLSITQPSALQIVNFSAVNVLCNGNNTGSININVTGGTGAKQYNLLPLSISSSSGVFSNLVAGTYTVFASDANGCTISSIATITQPSAVQFSSFSINHIACNGGNTGSINAQCIGGAGTYNHTLLPLGIINTSGTFNNLLAGTYTVQVVDANGCTLNSITTLNEPPILQITNTSITPIDCYGNNTGSIQIIAAGGSGIINYQINPGAITNTSGLFTSLANGIYTINVSDAQACTTSAVVSITQPSSLQFSTTSITHPTCSNLSNGMISFSASGGSPAYLYALNTGMFSASNSFINLSSGNYTLYIKDANGCVKDSIVALAPLSNLSFTSINIQHIHCKYENTGSISLNIINGIAPYLYQLNGVSTGSNSNFLNLIAGAYSIFVIDSIGCTKDTMINVNEPALALNFNNINLQNIKCYGEQTGEISSNAGGGTAPYQFSLNGLPFQSSGTYFNLSAGTFTLQVKDFYGCTKDTVLVLQQPLGSLNLFLKNLKEISCIGLEDGEIRMGVSGGTKPYTFKINGVSSNDSSFINLKSGVYIIEVIDSNGCKEIIAFTIATPTKKPSIILENLIGNICKGEQNGSIDWLGINGFTPYQYTVNGNFLDTVSALNNLTSGNYFIELVDNLGCKADTTFTIANSTTLDVQVETTPATCTSEGNDGKAQAIITGGMPPYLYHWIGYSDSTSLLQKIKYGEHLIVVRDAENCIDTSSYIIDYKPCCDLYMPNAFSPNGDGRNDTYRMITYGFINVKSFEIFDRWGKKIFYSNNITGDWDGKFQGIYYEIGTYYYLVKYYCQLSKELMIKKGDFTLLR